MPVLFVIVHTCDVSSGPQQRRAVKRAATANSRSSGVCFISQQPSVQPIAPLPPPGSSSGVTSIVATSPCADQAAATDNGDREDAWRQTTTAIASFASAHRATIE
ncbi:hypothetical protein Dimus_035903, partial [Dionaea muscipula]